MIAIFFETQRHREHGGEEGGGGREADTEDASIPQTMVTSG
jgi:hypothetical protein